MATSSTSSAAVPAAPQASRKKLVGNQQAIGIDLGTTNSVIAFCDPEDGMRPKVIPFNGKEFLPSVVCIEGVDKESYGWDPIENGLGRLCPDRFFSEVKRIIGKTVPESMEMAQFQAFRADMSYRMELSDGVPTIRFKLGDQQCRLQAWEVSAKLLTFMHEIANQYVRQPADDPGRDMCPGLVITVPAHFSSEQVEATRRAAARANFAQVEIIYEPEAAAYYYEAFLGNKMKRLPNDSSVLVVDFGGGTFDLSILKFYPNKEAAVKLTESGGDDMLGGRDFDVALMRHFNAFIVREKGDRYDVFPSAAAFREVVLSGEDRIFQRRWTLHQAARNLKEQLARRDTARVTLRQYFDDLSTLQLSITGQEFAQVCDHLLAKAGDAIRNFLDRTKQKPDNFAMLLLVGGSTRMPAFMGVLHGHGFTDRQIHKSNDVDRSVALGAAIHASQCWQRFVGLACAPDVFNVFGVAYMAYKGEIDKAGQLSKDRQRSKAKKEKRAKLAEKRAKIEKKRAAKNAAFDKELAAIDKELAAIDGLAINRNR